MTDDLSIMRSAAADIEPQPLLESLHDYAALSKFSLALYSQEEGVLASLGRRENLCGIGEARKLCSNACGNEIRQRFQGALNNTETHVFCCKAGVYNFFVPFKGPHGHSWCLVGGGVRDTTFSLERLETLFVGQGIDGIAMLEEWESLSETSDKEIRQAISEAEKLLNSLRGDKFFAQSFEKTVMLMNAVSDLFPGIDAATEESEVIALVSEALTVLFDVPRIALLLPVGDGGKLICRSLLGDVPEQLVDDEQGSLRNDWQQCRRFTLKQADIATYFPHIDSRQMLGFPLMVDGRATGCLALFDVELSNQSQTMIELLADKVAAKLHRLERGKIVDNEGRDAERLLELFSRLARSSSRRELFDQLLHMASGLLDAQKGSLMVLDEFGERLSIAASIGMNPTLAKAMLIRAGEGIAGKVLETGHALVIHDVEQDKRVNLPKRPRYESKSLISVPLQHAGKLFGVLNLSDRSDGSPFSEYDLQILSRFIEQGCGLISRVTALENTGKLEKMTVTDPLTGLYNRHVLEKRLGEEINRSRRHKQSLSLMMVSIDFFAEYLEMCGEQAGDKALEKVAAILRKSAREMDVVTRLEGEEFCLLLPNTSAHDSLMVAERIRGAVERQQFTHEESLPNSRVTVSIGIADYCDGQDKPDTLMHAADMALFKSKHAGCNRVTTAETQNIDAASSALM